MNQHSERYSDRTTARHSGRYFLGSVNLSEHAKRREGKGRHQTGQQGKAPHRTTPHQKPLRLAFASFVQERNARGSRRMMTFGISS